MAEKKENRTNVFNAAILVSSHLFHNKSKNQNYNDGCNYDADNAEHGLV